MPSQPSKASLTHLDATGAAHMVDVSSKPPTTREAVAEGELHARADVLDAIFNASPSSGAKLTKGDALAVARIAGIQAAKRTADIIPLCHPIATQYVGVEITRNAARGCAIVRATVRVVERTGAEMEALVATTAALLTLYDMAKSMQRDMRIEAVRLREKSGGASGDVAFA